LKPLIIARATGRRNSFDAADFERHVFRPEIQHFCPSHIVYHVIYMKPFPFGAILGEFEQLVLLALLRLGNGAFGAAIHREIVTRTGRDLPAGAVYVTLDRLEAKRMVCSYVGTPTAQRGGRRRKHYLLDTAGQRALVRAYRTFSAMTAGLQDELDELTARLWPGATGPAPRHVGW
jgi:DNA-binding PadR family transcriptional regulator